MAGLLLYLFVTGTLIQHPDFASAEDENVTADSNRRGIVSSSEDWHIPCPWIGPDMYGDVRYHAGCHLWKDDPSSSESLQEDKMKKPALNKWLDQLSEQLLNSTEIVNNLGQQKQQEEGTTGGCQSKKCSSAPLRCCRAEIRLAYPLYGISLTTGRLVKIIQETEAGGIQQPVVYRHCLSDKASLVRGRCHQSRLPRLFYVQRDPSPSKESLPFYQDLLVMPSNCDCLIQLHEEEDVDETDPSERDDGSEGSGQVAPAADNGGHIPVE